MADTAIIAIGFARKDSAIASLDDMKGKVFGIGDPNSTSEYLIPSIQIPGQINAAMKPGDYFGEVKFTGGHEQTIVAVSNGDIDAGATWADGLGKWEAGYNSGALGKASDAGIVDRNEIVEIWRSKPIPAMLAIALHSVGALGKLFSEVNENADLKPVEGVASTGAGWLQRMWYGVVSQTTPTYFSSFLLRFEINVRTLAILGVVGAGGIGYDLRNIIGWGQGQYDDATAIFILLFLSLVAVDFPSGVVRARLTGRTAQRARASA
ncbi:MAG: PhnD/SsuA/transferrin family substrate-binding protein [Pseudomonadota bacterium]